MCAVTAIAAAGLLTMRCSTIAGLSGAQAFEDGIASADQRLRRLEGRENRLHAARH